MNELEMLQNVLPNFKKTLVDAGFIQETIHKGAEVYKKEYKLPASKSVEKGIRIVVLRYLPYIVCHISVYTIAYDGSIVNTIAEKRDVSIFTEDILGIVTETVKMAYDRLMPQVQLLAEIAMTGA